MATVLFIVKATIPKDKEAAFNKWYNDEHCPQALQLPMGLTRLSGRPYIRPIDAHANSSSRRKNLPHAAKLSTCALLLSIGQSAKHTR